jgi:hypothetical protein
MSGGKILEQIEIDLRSRDGYLTTVYIDVYDNSLSKKWLAALNELLEKNYHLEKNYCFFGFVYGERSGQVILDQINKSITAINSSDLGYQIDDVFTMENCLSTGPIGHNAPGRKIIHSKFNQLHRYFEDLQGQSGRMSPYFLKASPSTKWHIRQLNLLCHEFESWALSYRKEIQAPYWVRPSQLMCWINAPRFVLEPDDYELFGVETLSRPLGGVFVGVNKSVGKHHWEVYNDEGRDSRISELTTTTLISQTQGSGDFDIEWGNSPSGYPWQDEQLNQFRDWLMANGFNPDDKYLTIGHPQIGQVNLEKSFGSTDCRDIWQRLTAHLDVYKIRTSTVSATYDYRWDDVDFIDRQISIISKGHSQ